MFHSSCEIKITFMAVTLSGYHCGLYQATPFYDHLFIHTSESFLHKHTEAYVKIPIFLLQSPP